VLNNDTSVGAGKGTGGVTIIGSSEKSPPQPIKNKEQSNPAK
jgi:hypothetical protein